MTDKPKYRAVNECESCHTVLVPNYDKSSRGNIAYCQNINCPRKHIDVDLDTVSPRLDSTDKTGA